MDLKDFISEALIQIVEGVSVAQGPIREKGGEVSPKLSGGPSLNSAHGFIQAKSGGQAQLVQFDVALTVKDEAGAKGKIGVVSGLFNIGGGTDLRSENASVTTIRFKVPLILPSPEGT